MKRIFLSLTTAGDLKKAIKELDQYEQSLYSKSALFVSRLAELGVPIIHSRIGASHGDSNPNHNTYITVNSFESYSEAKLVLEGRDILFFEFGAGVHYNTAAGTSPHPKGAEMGYTIGSYGKGQGKNDGWFYRDDNGDRQYSHGTEATMPMYKASLEIIANIRRIAREVFDEVSHE